MAKDGLNRYGVRLMEVLGEAERAAGEAGVGRRRLASALGVSEHTVAAWFKPSRSAVIPADRFFELACRADVLPAGVRDTLWSALGAEAGYIVAPQAQAEPEATPPLVRLAQMVIAMGHVASAVGEAVSQPSEGGRAIARREAAAILGCLRVLERHIASMRAGLERDGDGGASDRPAPRGPGAAMGPR